MSDNSRSRVTVTLGRGGRVVKRAGLSDDGYSNGVSMAGSKRSVRDRLGGDSDSRSHPYNKRQRGESFGTSSSNDIRLGKDDLRYKLLQKSTVRQSRNSDSRSNVDLRDKLSSRNRPSVNSKTMRPPEATASTWQHLPEHRDIGMTRHAMVEPRDSGLLGRTPSSRNTSEMSVVEPGRPYPSWTLDNIRRRSPERLMRPPAPRGHSPERNREELQRRPLIRAYDDGRSSSSVRVSPSRPVSSPFLTRSSLSAAPVRPVAPMPPHYPQTSGIIQKIPAMHFQDEPLSVEGLLHSLGLEKYVINFKAEEIDMNALRQLGDHDLKELGIPMGPRKKIIQAVMARSRRHL